MRTAEIKRETKETQIALQLNLDGKGDCNGSTGIGFFDHMLTLFARYASFDLTLNATGDLAVDTHHLVEDIGIVLGQSFRRAVGDCRGIARYGSFSCPMDETLTRVDLDISGRGFLVFRVTFTRERVGDFETEMLKEFLYAFAVQAGITLHVNTLYGENNHHILESIFKALGAALKRAVEIVDPEGRIPSTKGLIGG